MSVNGKFYFQQDLHINYFVIKYQNVSIYLINTLEVLSWTLQII